MSALPSLDIHLFGPGLVGGTLLDQIRAQRQLLAQRGTSLRLRTLCDITGALEGEDLDLTEWRDTLARDGRPLDLDAWFQARKAEAAPNAVFVDTSAAAFLADLYPRAFDAGLHVVCANKKANSGSMAQYRELRRRAADAGRRFLYETNAGAGLPVIDTMRNLVLSGDRFVRVEGILSGSLSFILGLLAEGVPFSMAVKTAKAKGFTEPDPRDDLSGMDVMRKVLILGREAGLDVEPAAVRVEGLLPTDFDASGTVDELMARLPQLDERFGAQVARLKAQGRVLRYVGVASPTGCAVGLVDVGPDHPLFPIQGGENAISLQTERYDRPMVVRGYGAGAGVTAAGVFADLLRLCPPQEA